MKSLLPPELQAAWNVRDTVSRRERMAELAFAGYSIPRCGRFKDMVRLGVPLVVYTDPFSHCGEGKALWKPENAFCWSADAFCSEHVPDDGDKYTDRETGVTCRINVIYLWLKIRSEVANQFDDGKQREMALQIFDTAVFRPPLAPGGLDPDPHTHALYASMLA